MAGTAVQDPPRSKPPKANATPDVAATGGREPGRDAPDSALGESPDATRERDREAWRRWKDANGEPNRPTRDARSDDAPAGDRDDPDDTPPPRRAPRRPEDDQDDDTPPEPSARRRSEPRGDTPPSKPDDEAATERRVNEHVARTVLERDGFAPKQIARMLKGADDAELAELVRSRRKVHSDHEATGAELASLKAGDKGKAEEGAKPHSADEGGADDPVKAVIEHFRSVGDAKGAELLEKALTHVRGAQRGTAPQTPAPSRESERDMEDRAVFELRGPIADLSKKYPKLKGDEAQRRLVRMADRLFKERVFSQDESRNADAVLGRAAELLWPTDPRDAQARIIERNAEQRNGQPSPDSNAPNSDGGGMTEEQIDRQVFRMLKTGKYTPDELNTYKHRMMGRRRA